jgi:hypothetical protein
LKSVIKNLPQALFYIFNPKYIAHGPLTETLQIWDNLISGGKKVVAVGGSDAHALARTLGPLRRTLFPYRFHFRAINTHLLLPAPLSGNIQADKTKVLDAFASGHTFVGYDLPSPTRGFRYSAKGRDAVAIMGDEISSSGGVTLQIHLPMPAECRLIRNGVVIKNWERLANYTHITSEPGAYRIEAYLHAFGKRRGWIFSNPIYIR